MRTRLTFEKTLSLIPSGVCIPVISTVVKLSLSVVTCTLTFELCTLPDLALFASWSAPPKLRPLSMVVAGLSTDSGLDMRG
jgi:hypothetical protein